MANINKKYCGYSGKKEVLDFIENFLNLNNTESSEYYLKMQFTSGYCYYFAVILKSAFNRGEVCWCAPYSHFCWVDTDGTPYDIYGLCVSDALYFIPEQYLGDALNDFKHTGKTFDATEKDIQNIINKYINESDNKFELRKSKIDIYIYTYSIIGEAPFTPYTPIYLGFIEMNTFDAEECFRICNWSEYTNTKPNVLHANISKAGRGICFVNPENGEHWLSKTIGWMVGDRSAIDKYVENHKDKPIWD